jgi:hypothetical protein
MKECKGKNKIGAILTYPYRVLIETLRTVKEFNRQIKLLEKYTTIHPIEDTIKRCDDIKEASINIGKARDKKIAEFQKAYSKLGFSLDDLGLKQKTMKRKEAIIEKLKEIDKLNTHLINIFHKIIELNNEASEDNVAELFTLSINVGLTQSQISMVRAQPIPPKKFKKGGYSFIHGVKGRELIIDKNNQICEVPVGSIVISPEDSEKILKDNGFTRHKDLTGIYSDVKPIKPILLSKDDIKDVEKEAKELEDKLDNLSKIVNSTLILKKETEIKQLKRDIKELKK